MSEKNSNSTISKVTLSCRVTPQQKLLIARRAKENGMSPAQYAEAKILMDDDLILRLDFFKLKDRNELLEKEYKKLRQYKKDINDYFDDDQLHDFWIHYGYMEEILDE